MLSELDFTWHVFPATKNMQAKSNLLKPVLKNTRGVYAPGQPPIVNPSIPLPPLDNPTLKPALPDLMPSIENRIGPDDVYRGVDWTSIEYIYGGGAGNYNLPDAALIPQLKKRKAYSVQTALTSGDSFLLELFIVFWYHNNRIGRLPCILTNTDATSLDDGNNGKVDLFTSGGNVVQDSIVYNHPFPNAAAGYPAQPFYILHPLNICITTDKVSLEVGRQKNITSWSFFAGFLSCEVY